MRVVKPDILRGDLVKNKFLLILLLATSLLMGCATSKSILADANFKNVVLLPVKFQRQEPDKCGITALASVMEYFNIEYSEIEQIYDHQEKGTKLITMINYSNKYIDTYMAHVGYEEIAKNIMQKKSLIIMRKNKVGGYHYFIVKGIILNEKKIVVNDGYDENVILDVTEDGKGKKADTALLFGKRKNSNNIP